MQEHSCGHIKAVFTGLIVICVQYQLAVSWLRDRLNSLLTPLSSVQNSCRPGEEL